MIQGTPRPIDLIGKSRLSDSFAGIGGFDHSKMGIGRLSTSGTLSELAGGAFSSLLGSRNVAALSEGLMPSLRTSGTLQSLLSSRGGISQIGGSIDQSALFARASAGGALGGFAAYRTSSLEQFLPMAGLEDAGAQWIAKSNLLGPPDSTAKLSATAGLLPSLSLAELLGRHAFDHSKMGIGRLSTSGTLSELAGGAFSSLLGSRNVAALSEGLMPSLRASGTLQSLLSSRGGISQIGGSIDQSALFARASAGGALGGFAAYRTSSLEQFLPMAGLEDAARSWIERVQRVPSILMRLQRVEQELAEADPASARLAVLLRHVGAGHAVATMEQMLSQGFQALVDPLAAILLSPEALGRFGTVIRNADLPSHVKNDLLHALEHLAEGSSDHALPPLLTGLEGAFRHAVRATGDRKSRSNARSLVAVLGMERDHKLLVGAIYDHANDARHGIELERRDACVLALVGLVVWMNECLEQPAIDWLGMRLDEQLSGSLEVAA